MELISGTAWRIFKICFFPFFPVGSESKEYPSNAWDLGSIPSLGRSLEKGMAPHSSILAWRIPWTEELVGYSPYSHKELDTTKWLTPLKWNSVPWINNLIYETLLSPFLCCKLLSFENEPITYFFHNIIR